MMWSRVFRLKAYAGLVLLVVLFCLLVAVVIPRKRTFVVNVKTHSFDVSGATMTSFDWPFQEAVVCVRKAAGTSSANIEENALCAPRFYSESVVQEPLVSLAASASTHVRLERQGGPLSILSENSDGAAGIFVDGAGLPSRSTIIVPNAAEQTLGALPLSGFVGVGEIPASGETGLLVAGTYEIRGLPFLSGRSVALSRGTLFPGDRLEVVDQHGNATVTSIGHVTINDDGTISLQFVTEPAFSRLKLSRLGSEPAFISASWIDRLLNDPRIVFLSVAIAMIGGAIDLTGKARRSLVRKSASLGTRKRS